MSVVCHWPIFLAQPVLEVLFTQPLDCCTARRGPALCTFFCPDTAGITNQLCPTKIQLG